LIASVCVVTIVPCTVLSQHWWKRTQSGTLIWNLVIFPWRTVWGRRASIREVVIPWLLKEMEGSRRIGFVLLSDKTANDRLLPKRS
jgi:hypothetical protein